MVWSARRMWWSTPCRVSRGAHASMMRRRGIRPQKSPPAHRVHNREVHHTRGRAGGASTATPARPPADDAPVRPTVPGDGDSVGDTGAPNRHPTVGAWTPSLAPGSCRAGALAPPDAAV